MSRLSRILGTVGGTLQAYAKRIEGIGLPTIPDPVPSPQTVKRLASPDILYGLLSAAAGPSQTRYSTYPATGLTPSTISSILANCDKGIVYQYADMCLQVLHRDAHMAGVDRSRRVEVACKPFRVHATSEDPVAQGLAAFVRAVIDQIDGFDSAIYSMLGANAVGWSGLESVYKNSVVKFKGTSGDIRINGVFPEHLEWVHPKHFWFSLDTDEPMIDLGVGGRVPLPPFKFIFHGAAGDGFYEHRGYMRQAIWLHMLKHNSIRDWAVFSALFGIPNIYGKIPRMLYENQEFKDILALALQDYGQGKPAVIPDDLEIEAKPGPIGSGAADVHARLVAFCNQELSKLIQSETLTTEMSGTGSYNASDTHDAVRHAVIKLDGKAAAGSIRRDLFRSVVELNMSALSRELGASPDEIRQAMPWCSWRIEREVTPLQRAQIADTAINRWGLELDEEQMREEYAFDRPRPGTKGLRGMPVAISSGGKTVSSLDAGEGSEAPKPEKAV